MRKIPTIVASTRSLVAPCSNLEIRPTSNLDAERMPNSKHVWSGFAANNDGLTASDEAQVNAPL
eukprot:scaffold64710_cov68-Phaeocystis_antarctica.AAC.4